MKEKRMRRDDWLCIEKKRYLPGPARLFRRDGVAGLIVMDRVTSPVAVPGLLGDVVIADNGYSWLEFAPKEGCFFATAQFDAQNRLIQIYFDITSSCGICFDDVDNPSFLDAYLDLVWDPLTGLKEMDRDELNDALRKGCIDLFEYEHAQKACSELAGLLRQNGRGLADEFTVCRRRLQEKLY